MNARTFLSFLILVVALLITIVGCTTISKIQEERVGIEPQVFFQSVKSGDYAEVKRLIGEGADVNAQNSEGWTALMLASDQENPAIAKLLIDEGADVNIQDNEGWTALLWALREGYPEIAELLREAGAKEY